MKKDRLFKPDNNERLKPGPPVLPPTSWRSFPESSNWCPSTGSETERHRTTWVEKEWLGFFQQQHFQKYPMQLSLGSQLWTVWHDKHDNGGFFQWPLFALQQHHNSWDKCCLHIKISGLELMTIDKRSRCTGLPPGEAQIMTDMQFWKMECIRIFARN